MHLCFIKISKYFSPASVAQGDQQNADSVNG